MRQLSCRCSRNRNNCSIWFASALFILLFFLTTSCDAGTLNSISAVSTAAAAAAQAASQMAEEAAISDDNEAMFPAAPGKSTADAAVFDDVDAIMDGTVNGNSTADAAVGNDADAILDGTVNGKEGDASNATLANSPTSNYTTAAVQGLPPGVVTEANNQNDKDDKDGKKGSKKKNADDKDNNDSNNKKVDQPLEQTPVEENDILLEEDPYPYLVSRDNSLCAYEVAGILTCIQWESFCTGECEFNSYQYGSGCHVTQKMPKMSDKAIEPAGCGCQDTNMCKCYHPLHDREYLIGRECHSDMRADSGEQALIFPGVLHVDGEDSTNESGGSGRRKLGGKEGDHEEESMVKRRSSRNLRSRV